MKKLTAILLLAFTLAMGFSQKASYQNKDYELLYEQDKYQEIIDDITQKDESEFTAGDYFYLGSAYFQLKNDDQAQKYLNKAIQIDPKFAAPYYYLGGIHLFSGNYEEAIPYYEKCIELVDKKNKDTRPYQILGEIYLELGDYQKALDYFTKFYSLDKKNPEASYQMAYTLSMLNEFEKASPYAEAYLKRDNNSFTMNNIVILNLYAKGNYKKAEKYEKQLIEIWKNSQEDYLKEQEYFPVYSFSYNGYDLSVLKKLDQTELFYDLLLCVVYSDGKPIKSVTLEYDGFTAQIVGGASYFIGTFDLATQVHSTASIAYEKCPDFSEFIKCVKLALDGELEISASSKRN